MTESDTGRERSQASEPPPVPFYLGIRGVLLLATMGTLLGLVIIFANPVSPPDEGYLARLQWWRENAERFEKAHRLR
jgi:hypothetical protein